MLYLPVHNTHHHAICVKFMYEAFFVLLFNPCIPFCFSASYFGRIKEIIFVWKWIDTPKAKRFVYWYFFFFCNASSTWWKSPIASSAADFKCWELGKNKLIAVVCLFWLIMWLKIIIKGYFYRKISFFGKINFVIQFICFLTDYFVRRLLWSLRELQV